MNEQTTIDAVLIIAWFAANQSETGLTNFMRREKRETRLWCEGLGYIQKKTIQGKEVFALYDSEEYFLGRWTPAQTLSLLETALIQKRPFSDTMRATENWPIED